MLEWQPVQNRGFRNVYRNGQLIGFQVAYRSTYYRGIWLSMSTGFDVTVDGEKFPRDRVTVTIGGKTYTQEEMKKIGNVNWPISELAILTVAKPGGLRLGVHDVTVTWGHRISYMAPGGGGGGGGTRSGQAGAPVAARAGSGTPAGAEGMGGGAAAPSLSAVNYLPLGSFGTGTFARKLVLVR